MIQARTAVNEIIGIQNRPAFYDAGFGSFVRQPSGSVFSPASLFAAGEQGVWYDPSNFATMFQDSAGTTPVTAVEQPVGKILDLSGRGNHATQATSANRPVLSARVNLLLATATLATQSVTTLATTYTLAFSGAGTVVTSGTNIGVYTAGTRSITCTAGTLTLTVTGSVTSADLRSTTDGVGLPAYQRVTTSTDYDTTGFPLYLAFNGTNSNMATGTITPNINKAQAFVGVRKLIDTVQVLYELSTNLNSGNGALASLTGFNGAIGTAGPYWNALSKGTVATQSTSPASFSAPRSAVQTSLHDISGPFLTLRINNTQVATSTLTQGTGNFLAYPLYIGSRAGISLFFAGRVYSLILRFGANLDATTVTNTETWVNGKTKAYA